MTQALPTPARDGFFYVATGDRFRTEALQSVKSLRRHMPTAHVTLYSDAKPDTDAFDRVIVLEEPQFSNRDKIRAFQCNDYERAVFLDSDTIITGDLSSLFVLLERYDFAATLSVARGFWYHELDLPDSFPELNSGVVAFRKSPATDQMFQEWMRIYVESAEWQPPYLQGKKHPWDQPALRRALYDARTVRLAVLSTEFNALRHFGTYLWGKTKIVHGRGNIQEIAERFDRMQGVERVFLQEFGVVAPPSRMSVPALLQMLARVNFVAARELLRRTWRTLWRRS